MTLENAVEVVDRHEAAHIGNSGDGSVAGTEKILREVKANRSELL